MQKIDSKSKLFGVVLGASFLFFGAFMVLANQGQDGTDSVSQAQVSAVLGAKDEAGSKVAIDAGLSTITDDEDAESENDSDEVSISTTNPSIAPSEESTPVSTQEPVGSTAPSGTSEGQTNDQQDNDGQDEQENNDTENADEEVAPSYDFNLNDIWYISGMAAKGYYNSCWPTEVTEENFDECMDKDHPLSDAWFYGIGISLSPEEAFDLASKDLSQNLNASKVAGLKGGGGDPFVLTEAHCQEHSLSCGRW